MMPINRIAALFAIALLIAPVAAAQGKDSSALEPQETRASIQAAAQEAALMAQRAPSKEQKQAQEDRARILRERLANGDLRVGDKVIVDAISGLPPEFTDTFTVRNGQKLLLPGTREEIPVRGLLRSELTDTITAYLKRTYNNPVIRTSTMMSIFVTGQVIGPGSRTVRPDALLTDVVTPSGTLTSEGNIEKITIRRNNIVLYPPESTYRALTTGRTIDDMQLIGGDEIRVGAIRRTSWGTIIQLATGITGLVLGIVSISRR